jgi:L-glutamine-phosphate cytidylyltransferase
MIADAIVLVAGMSTRIRSLTGGLPKSFLKVGEETLIGRTERLLRGAGVSNITLVTGFEAEVFQEAFPHLQFVHSPDFATTNTSVSLSLALNARKQADEQPVLVVNGDVYYAEGILESMLARREHTLAAVKRHDLSEEEVKVFVEGERITRIGKHLEDTMSYGEAFGIYLLNPRFQRYLRQELNVMGNRKIFYEEAMDRLLGGGHDIRLHDVGDAIVQEIDFVEDYESLKQRV